MRLLICQWLTMNCQIFDLVSVLHFAGNTKTNLEPHIHPTSKSMHASDSTAWNDSFCHRLLRSFSSYSHAKWFKSVQNDSEEKED